MSRILPIVAALALVAGPVRAADASSVEPTGAELAACRSAADQPICLLQVEARNRSHRPYDASIEIGYAPDVMAAIGHDWSNALTNPFLERLMAPERAAVQALIADNAGGKPADALAPIRAIPVLKAGSPELQPGMDSHAAYQRIRAYQMIWNAGHGEAALPAAHRPSSRLAQAALEAWTSDLPLAGNDGSGDDLAKALRESGDPRAAARIPRSTESGGLGQIRALLDDGRFDEAAKALAAMKPSSGPAAVIEIAVARMEVINKATAAGRTDIGLRLAREQLRAWFAELADPAHHGSARSGADIPASLVLVAQFAPRAEAIKWTERMDAAARQAAPLPAAESAYAAAHAWTRLEEPTRASALLALWPAPTEAELKDCLAHLFRNSAGCLKSPGMALAVMLKATPLDASWDELMPISGPMTLAKRRAARGLAGVDADLAKATTAEQRFLILQTCTGSEVESLPPAVTAVCAHRLAVEPAPAADGPLPTGWPSYAQRRLDGALSVARQAAQTHDLKTMRDMIDLSFGLAAGMPDQQVNASYALQVVAIAELREQGRL
jgi:hypothetical protein